jgi:hypothetical protein
MKKKWGIILKEIKIFKKKVFMNKYYYFIMFIKK